MAEAANFSEETSYAIGSYCLKDGFLCRFTSAHSGAWDWDDVVMVDTDLETMINMVLHVDSEVVHAAEFAESLVFEPSLIEGTRYKYILTDNT